MKDPPDQPGKFTARLAASRPSPYVLIGDTLAAVHGAAAAWPGALGAADRGPAGGG